MIARREMLEQDSSTLSDKDRLAADWHVVSYLAPRVNPANRKSFWEVHKTHLQLLTNPSFTHKTYAH